MKTINEELDEIFADYREWIRGIRTDRLIGVPEKVTKQRIRSLILRERLNEAEAMWEMFDGYYADASDLCDYAPDRIKALKSELKGEEE